jgi:hypothetical protein
MSAMDVRYICGMWSRGRGVVDCIPDDDYDCRALGHGPLETNLACCLQQLCRERIGSELPTLSFNFNGQCRRAIVEGMLAGYLKVPQGSQGPASRLLKKL